VLGGAGGGGDKATVSLIVRLVSEPGSLQDALSVCMCPLYI
jgi:hypothetical protein